MIVQFDDRSSAKYPIFSDNQLTIFNGVDVALDQEKVGAVLDRKEARARHVDALGVTEMLDGCPRSRFELATM
jgi:hypothetical protein